MEDDHVSDIPIVHAAQLLVATAAAGALSMLPGTLPAAAGDDTSIRPFRANVSDEAVADLRRRLQATRWPDKETVADSSQGAQMANLQELVRYWTTDYDWRKGEAKLNAFRQFMTGIDGVNIHFIHVRSRHPNALPLIITHGWPGSVFEQIKIIGPLTDPAAYGGRAEDAFDVVIPSLPGYGFSSRPTETGWDVERIGRAWDVLMKRLGYTRYVSQGGDWGAGVVEAMGRQAPAGLLGIHTNLPAVFPTDAAAAIASGGAAPAGLSESGRAAFDDVRRFLQNGGWGYYQMMTARPQAVGYGLTDSPAGLAGWMLVHGGFEKWAYGKDPKQEPTVDEVLDNFSLHWLTNTVASQGQGSTGRIANRTSSARPRRRPTRLRSRWLSRPFRTTISFEPRRREPAAPSPA
jgi:pimeloyl-ACP methyl ester carboxylesterase